MAGSPKISQTLQCSAHQPVFDFFLRVKKFKISLKYPTDSAISRQCPTVSERALFEWESICVCERERPIEMRHWSSQRMSAHSCDLRCQICIEVKKGFPFSLFFIRCERSLHTCWQQQFGRLVVCLFLFSKRFEFLKFIFF